MRRIPEIATLFLAITLTVAAPAGAQESRSGADTTVTGTVVSVEPEFIAVETDSGEMRFVMTNSTERPQDLVPGTRVRISTRPRQREGTDLVAASVRALDKLGEGAEEVASRITGDDEPVDGTAADTSGTAEDVPADSTADVAAETAQDEAGSTGATDVRPRDAAAETNAPATAAGPTAEGPRGLGTWILAIVGGLAVVMALGFFVFAILSR